MEASPILPLSVVIVARNEERNLPRCLASVRGWCAETWVALNQTTDGSEAVARALGARVCTLDWKGFRDTKNEALALATRPWVLCLDADEEVSESLRAEISRFLSRKGGRFAGARFPRKVWFLGRWITHGDWYPDLSLRLVRRGSALWCGDAHVHEKLVCEGAVATLKGDLHHYSFEDLSAHVDKINPFAELFVRQQRERGTRFSAFQAVARPAWRFFRGYVLRRGFLDGFPGYYIAQAVAFGTFVRYSRLYEEEQGRKRPTP